MHAETVVKLLLAAGHDPNFPSPIHETRTPLGELCLLADPNQREEALESILEALIKGGADPLKKSGSMLPIFTTFFHINLEYVLRPLVEQFIYKQLNDPNYKIIFVQDEFAYSPTIYIKQFIIATAREDKIEEGFDEDDTSDNDRYDDEINNYNHTDEEDFEEDNASDDDRNDDDNINDYDHGENKAYIGKKDYSSDS